MEGEGRVSAARLLLRFGIGTTELAGERLIAALREIDSVIARPRLRELPA